MKHVILSTDTSVYTYEDYLEWCECNNKTPYPKDSHEFFQWTYDEVNYTIEDDMINLKHSKLNDGEFIITGNLGLWNGRPDIVPVHCNGILSAIDTCINDSSIWDYDVYINDDESFITVIAKHHDGSNYFELHLLSHDGAEAYFNALDDYNYGSATEMKIKEDWFKPITIKDVWG